MKFHVKLVVTPGDTQVDRAEITMVDQYGQEDTQKVILEGEKVDVDIMLGAGAKIVIKELERPVVYNPETHAAEYLDLTPKDPLTTPKPPPTEAAPKVTPAANKTHK